MALLTLNSFEQILGQMITTILAQTGINDIVPGSVLLTLLEAAANEDFNQYVQMVNIIQNYNLDTTTGTNLDNRAAEFGLTRNQPVAATGTINITRASTFTKVSTNFYAGKPAPIAGSTILYVNNASSPLFGSSGSLILGRGTSSEEVVSYSTSPVNNTYYWTITLTAPTTNNHVFSDSIILSQGGNQTITAGTQIQVPAVGTSPQILFTINNTVVLEDGEFEVDNVPITAVLPGSTGNIPVKAINGPTAFLTPPFTGAQAYNSSRFTSGQDLETDAELRNRIKNTIQTLSKGVVNAILNSIIGLTDPVSAQSVVSAAVIQPTTETDNVKVYIDNGIGLEPSFSEQGFETLLQTAIGGEQRFQLSFSPVVKAQLISQNSGPYNMSSVPLSLTYNVGLSSETITFESSDFQYVNSATVYEVVNAINSKASLISARTTNDQSNVVISAIVDTNEQIEVLHQGNPALDANGVLGFPANEVVYTLNLYKNDVLLNKDGSTAYVKTTNNAPFNFAALPASFLITVDGKSSNVQTVSFQTSDFANPAAATAQEVVAVINAQVAGVTATAVNNNFTVQIASNTVDSSSSQILIAAPVSGNNANSVLGFPTSAVTGTNSDYTFNRFIGQLQLTNPLVANDLLTAGSQYTRAHVRAASPETYSISSGSQLVISADGGSAQTYTFPSTLTGLTAAALANIINSNFNGINAYSRTINNLNYLEISTNSYSSYGSIQVTTSPAALSLSTALVTNQKTLTAYVVAQNSAPFSFPENQQLIVVMDNNPAQEIYTTIFNFQSSLAAAPGASPPTSTTNLYCQNFSYIFPIAGELINYWLVMDSGVNTTTGNVSTVTNVSGNSWLYTFTAAPPSFSSYAIGDAITFSSMLNAGNNGSFLITAINTAGPYTVTVTNVNGIAESSSPGHGLIGARRQISNYTLVNSTGNITLSAALPFTPATGDLFSVIPYTTVNLVSYMNNLYITQLSLSASIESVDNATLLQIASLQQGSNGYVQVTGGLANNFFGFSTGLIQGIPAYDYYTGLVALVNKTIYGSSLDPVTFPGVGAAGVQFDVQAPLIKEIAFELLVTLQAGFTISALADQIYTAVTGYVNSLNIGAPVILSEIISAIVQISGVEDVQIVSPTSNVQVAQNQLAKTSSNLISFS